jgi:hypothetical protein
MAPPKIFINIILNIIKKLTKLNKKGGKYEGFIFTYIYDFFLFKCRVLSKSKG